MSIKLSPKWLLSSILCLPIIGLTGESPRTTDLAQANKVHTVAKKTSLSAHPKRGMTMKQVRKYYGKPHSVRKSKGKVKKQWPRITIWNYGSYSVYFERHTVLHTVIK